MDLLRCMLALVPATAYLCDDGTCHTNLSASFLQMQKMLRPTVTEHPWPHARGKAPHQFGNTQEVWTDHKLSWSYHHPDGRFHNIMAGGPVIDVDKNLYLMSGKGLIALSPSGDVRWTYETPGPSNNEVTLHGDLVLGTTKEGNAFAVDRRTGKTQWVTKLAKAPDLPETNFLEVRRKLLSYRNSIPQDERPDYVVEVVSLPATQAAIKRDEGFMRQQSEPVPSKSFAGTMRRQVSAQVERPRRAAPVQLTPSANAWKPKKESNPQEELKRQVQGLLNKICPENVASIIEKIAAIKVEEITQLEAIIELMFKKAITEPHYCETYADMVFSLKAVYPSFPAPDGGKPVTFKGLVLNICQSEFEQLLTSGDVTEEEKAKLDHEEIDFLRKKRKDRMRANMKFIGHLFLRQLLSAKVIGSVICELVLCEQVEDLPEEHALECACELLLAIGYTMENMAAGQTALTSVCGRLKDLMKRKREDGKAAYCKRVQFMIQDVLDTRAAGWQKKVFKAAAKTKEEIRLEQEKEITDRAKGKDVAPAGCVVTGARPVYLSRATGA
ncbi:unnamed protein product [Effrenium voratum]|nr:unnamed protein product [Effrenium voratum]